MSDARAPECKEADRREADRRDAQEAEPRAPGPAVPAPRARQAVTGHDVRYVMAFGIIGVVIGLFVVYQAYFG